jgi:hypothetical protein
MSRSDMLHAVRSQVAKSLNTLVITVSFYSHDGTASCLAFPKLNVTGGQFKLGEIRYNIVL